MCEGSPLFIHPEARPSSKAARVVKFALDKNLRLNHAGNLKSDKLKNKLYNYYY
jgi:hypothetical protein